MYNFFLEIVFMLSLGLMVYLLAIALPRVQNNSKNRVSEVISRLIKRVPLERIDSVLNTIFEKILRKFRVIILKIDNWVSSSLGRVKASNKSETKDQPTLFEKE